jgi:hypothetical protein
VSSLSTEAGDVGVQLVRVRQSQATQVTAVPSTRLFLISEVSL